MITGAQLISPQGRIQPKFFPELSAPGALAEHLDAFVADAYAKGAVSDAAAEAWAYHRAYSELYESRLVDPTETEAGPVREKFDPKLLTEFERRADSWLATWISEQAADPDVPSTLTIRRVSGGSPPTVFRW